MVTRRCDQRTFRLRPSDETNDIFRYCIARAARQTGVLVHAVCVMSNHEHIVLTDVEGRLPDFTRELHRNTAKAVNASQGQFENLWSADRCHVLELGDETDVIRKIAYLAANPVDAGLVERPEDWPGVMCLPGDEVREERVARPEVYFGKIRSAPEEEMLRIVPPPGMESVAERVAAAVEERLEAAWAKMREAGWAFLGRAGVLAISFVKRAKSFEKKWQLVPQIAARSGPLRKKLLEAQREFRRAYYAALDAWCAGVRSAVFPVGTWWLRVFHNVAVAAPA
jgi:REP element-mobilizing transposase RayT